MCTALAPADQLLYTPKEAAEVLRYGRSTVYELMAEGVLKHVKRGRSAASAGATLRPT